MTVLVPRLSREFAREVLAATRGLSLSEVTELMPREGEHISIAPVGGRRVSEGELGALREAILSLAREHGFPDEQHRLVEFDGWCAWTLRGQLDLSPHEAGHEDVWSYLTCCWLLDVAIWRFGSDADERRFLGNVNRNTFRRLWWRAEVLGSESSVPFDGLGEDELVNVMERPTISGNPRLARTIVDRFVGRLAVEDSLSSLRMHLMRDLMKRLVRLTSFVDLDGLDDNERALVIDEQIDHAVCSLTDRPEPPRERPPFVVPEISDVVEILPPRVASTPTATPSAAEWRDIANFAVSLAKRTGRVTNGALREVFPINSSDAREILTALVDGGLLERRGEKRGTHYVVPAAEAERTESPEAVAETTSSLRRVLRPSDDSYEAGWADIDRWIAEQQVGNEFRQDEVCAAVIPTIARKYPDISDPEAFVAHRLAMLGDQGRLETGESGTFRRAHGLGSGEAP